MDSVLSFIESIWNWFVKLLGTIWYWIHFVLLAVLAMPAMWILVYLYPVWQKWVTENGDLKKHWERIVLLIPFSLLIGLALILYRVFHGSFEAKISGKFGKKPF